jgi:hypothetical protein
MIERGEAMRVAGLLFAGILLFVVSARAQDKSLTDIARESREKKAQSSKPAKVITNEELGGGAPEPVKATDEPVQVVYKARAALLKDPQHVCQIDAAGNSGPGWNDKTLIEVGGQDRKHVVLDKNPGYVEYIMIGQQVYFRLRGQAWKRSEEMNGLNSTKLAPFLEGAELPQPLNFGYGAGDLKFVGSETAGGARAFRYEDKIHSGDMERTISIWIGANDGLFRKSDMQTTTRSTMGGPATVWRETATCSYGGNVMIEAPL